MDNSNMDIDQDEKRHYSKNIDKQRAFEQVSINDVRRIAILKFGSYSKIGQAIGVGQRRAWHILNGYYPPKTPEIIHKVANALDIDVILLTKIFNKIESKEKKEKEDEK